MSGKNTSINSFMKSLAAPSRRHLFQTTTNKSSTAADDKTETMIIKPGNRSNSLNSNSFLSPCSTGGAYQFPTRMTTHQKSAEKIFAYSNRKMSGQSSTK